jgi:hypothetical protein
VTDALASVRYCINIRGTLVKVTRYEAEEDHGQQVQCTFAKFAQRAVKDYRVGFRSMPRPAGKSLRADGRTCKAAPSILTIPLSP